MNLSNTAASTESSHDHSDAIDSCPDTEVGCAGDEEEQEILARKETRAVKGLKCIVLSVLTVSMIGIALAIYFYTRNSEKAHFEDAFADDAHKVLEAIGTAFCSLLITHNYMCSHFSLSSRHHSQASRLIKQWGLSTNLPSVSSLTLGTPTKLGPL